MSDLIESVSADADPRDPLGGPAHSDNEAKDSLLFAPDAGFGSGSGSFEDPPSRSRHFLPVPQNDSSGSDSDAFTRGDDIDDKLDMQSPFLNPRQKSDNLAIEAMTGSGVPQKLERKLDTMPTRRQRAKLRRATASH